MVKQIVFLIIIFTSMILSQESNPKINYEGKDISQLKHTWSAQWVTHPTESTLDYGVFNFRRKFKLETLPETYVIYVSADNRYRLFVNGKQVVFGPSVGDIDYYRFETLDIAEYLQQGENIVAAEVVNFGEFRRGAQQTFMTAFILQSDKNNEVSINTGDKKWKVSKNNAYNYIPFTSDSLRGYYAAGPGDEVDFKHYPWGWETLNFDDSGWVTPRLAMVEFAVGRGFLYGSTWYLVPRTIPFMESTQKRFDKVIRTSNCEVLNLFIEGKERIIIPPNTKASILVDNKVHTVGYPELILSKGNRSEVKITYSEALIFNDAYTDEFVDGNITFEDVKGNRNETEGKKIFGIYDIFYPDGGEGRVFRPLWMRTFRYIQIDIETKEEELTLEDFKYEFSAYPFEEKASFQSDNPFLSKMWEVAWRTVRNGAGEMFQDSPYYEQLQYIGDTRLESLISIYVSGDDRLMRKAIKVFDESRMPNGLTQSRYPSYINQVIPTYSLIWISMLHDYYIYRNDPQYIEQFIPGMRNVLEWFESKIDSTGMPTNLRWWNFTDWVSEFPNGIPPGADDGYSANVSLQLVYAMDKASELFQYFGWQSEAEKYFQLSLKIKEAVYDNCYDNSKEMFAETPDKGMFTQHTNIIAILSDVVNEESQKQLIKKILYEEDVIHTSIYFKFYLFRALQKTGMGDEFFNQLSPWKNMIDLGLTTFAETDVNPRSDCHAWSATPCFDLLHLVAGIYPTKPGFEEINIEPNFGKLSEIKAEMPHPNGMIKVDLKRSKNVVTGEISLPESIDGNFIWKGKTIKLESGKQRIK
ncbi:MAG: alpha-L-rhamnosidase N-terminal domain-containing protein, partial [Bacteroidota bacterium]